MHLRKQQFLAGVLILAGSATMALAWKSHSGMTHTTSSTCTSETCRRHCRECCHHFFSDPFSIGYATCEAGCAGLPLCPTDSGQTS